MDIVKLTAQTKDYIWGGKKLTDWGYGDPSAERIAEAWVLSFHDDGPSGIVGSDKLLRDAVTPADLGRACDGFPFFPVLIKLIDSADNLSVQVHPSDDYALANEGQFGKTELWYVADCDEGAGLYVGLKSAVDKQEFARRIADGTLLDILNFVRVRPGECYFIPSGTVHAIGKGCTIVEVQQNSNLTYRVYDFGRVGADGKPRALHIDRALKVADLSAYRPQRFDGDVLADCRYFTVSARKGGHTIGHDASFTAITATADGGTLNGMPLKKGDTWFIPAGKRAKTEGNAAYIETFVKERQQ